MVFKIPKYVLLLIIILYVSINTAQANDDAGHTLELQTLLSSITLHRATASTYNDAGFIYIKMHEPDKAISMLNISAAMNLSSPVICNNMGVAYMQKHDWEHAGKAFIKALAIEPDYVKSSYNLAVVRYKQGKYDEAISILKGVEENHPSYMRQRIDLLKLKYAIIKALKEHPSDQELQKIKRDIHL